MGNRAAIGFMALVSLDPWTLSTALNLNSDMDYYSKVVRCGVHLTLGRYFSSFFDAVLYVTAGRGEDYLRCSKTLPQRERDAAEMYYQVAVEMAARFDRPRIVGPREMLMNLEAGFMPYMEALEETMRFMCPPCGVTLSGTVPPLTFRDLGEGEPIDRCVRVGIVLPGNGERTVMICGAGDRHLVLAPRKSSTVEKISGLLYKASAVLVGAGTASELVRLMMD